MKTIWVWLKLLINKARGKKSPLARVPWPSKEQIEKMPAFEALEPDDIIEIVSADGAKRAVEELKKETVVGFDTESKPVFVKGQVSSGPHVAQFSTMRHAFIFLLHDAESRQAVKSLMKNENIKKVGFGLGDDLKRIRIKLKVEPKNVLDLETLFSAKGHGRGVGVKVAVAIALKRKFSKSKKASTSNWMSRHLTAKQLLYAANDAYAAVRVYHAMETL